ncbi:MAG: hypothetical protein WBY94_06615 [Polyangiaceae bacterium]
MTGPERIARRDALLAHYETAPVLYVPPAFQDFVVVTARGQAAKDVTVAWLRRHYGHHVTAFATLAGARTTERVVEFKAAFLREQEVTDYAEDNRAVVRGLRKVLSSCRVWHYKKGQMLLDYEAPL